jgi:hypothetical protein
METSNGMNKRKNNLLPFFIEFVKFSTGFAVIVAVALLSLHIITIAGG